MSLTSKGAHANTALQQSTRIIAATTDDDDDDVEERERELKRVADALNKEEKEKKASEKAAEVVTKYRNIFKIDRDGTKLSDCTYIDPRLLNLYAIERKHFYVYDDGILKTTFINDRSAKVRCTVFRQVTVDDEKKQDLLDIKHQADRTNVEVDDEIVRLILSQEYHLMKESAEQELLENQSKPSGLGVHRAVDSYTIPDAFAKVDYDFYREYNYYPFTYGLVLVKVATASESDATTVSASTSGSYDSTLYFACCASDQCRRKRVMIELKASISKEKKHEYVERHLKESHWNQLIQANDYN